MSEVITGTTVYLNTRDILEALVSFYPKNKALTDISETISHSEIGISVLGRVEYEITIRDTLGEKV